MTLFSLFLAGSLLSLAPSPNLCLLQMPKSLILHLLQGDIAAWVLFIWLVLMVDNT